MAAEYENSTGLAYRHISITVPKSLKSELEKFDVNMTQTCVKALSAEVQRKKEAKP